MQPTCLIQGGYQCCAEMQAHPWPRPCSPTTTWITNRIRTSNACALRVLEFEKSYTFGSYSMFLSTSVAVLLRVTQWGSNSMTPPTLTRTSSLGATHGHCKLQHLNYARLLRQRWQHSIARHTMHTHMSPLNGRLSQQSSVLCFSRHQKSLQQPDLPEELQRVRNIKQVGLTASTAILVTAAAAALTAGMRPPEQLTNSIHLEQLLWACGTVSSTMLCALVAAKLALGAALCAS